MSEFHTIGQVVNILKSSFSDITISKIRFLENEGLIKPQRTSGGYRKFSDTDLARLKAVLALQKEQYLPLSVIKKNPHLIEQNADNGDTHKAISNNYLEPPDNVSIKDALKKTGITKKQLEDFSGYFSITKKDNGEEQTISEIDVDILNIIKSLARFGIEPRHLKMYDNLVSKEALMIHQIVAPFAKNKRRLEEKVLDLTDALQNLQKLLLKKALLKEIDNN